MNQFKVIALTHRTLGLELVGKFHIEPEDQKTRLEPLNSKLNWKEFMFISTCNRVEFFFRSSVPLNEDSAAGLFKHIYPNLDEEERALACQKLRLYDGIDAIRHLFHVASSLDSLVVGEREIITQVRGAFELAEENGFAHDFIRIASTKAIETAKQVYTETDIATKPISVVNLAYRKLTNLQKLHNSRLVLIGAGQTIEAIARNFSKHSFSSIKVFNRTASKASKLANMIGGQGYGLSELKSKIGDFDVLVTCTGADRAIIDSKTYGTLVGNDRTKKTIVDLAIPNDIDPSVLTHFEVDYIAIDDLKQEAKNNLKAREKEIFHCEAVVEKRLSEFEEEIRTRKLELAMREIPQMMKEIKTQAVQKTFAKDIDKLDDQSKETLEKVLEYLEKKYIAIPMKMAKQVVLHQDLKDPIID